MEVGSLWAPSSIGPGSAEGIGVSVGTPCASAGVVEVARCAHGSRNLLSYGVIDGDELGLSLKNVK